MQQFGCMSNPSSKRSYRTLVGK